MLEHVNIICRYHVCACFEHLAMTSRIGEVAFCIPGSFSPCSKLIRVVLKGGIWKWEIRKCENAEICICSTCRD